MEEPVFGNAFRFFDFVDHVNNRKGELSLFCGGMLLVFRDLEKRKKVFAFPAVYINKRPEISDSI